MIDIEIKKKILEIIENAEESLTAGEIEKILSQTFSFKKKQVKELIKNLVEKGFLTYTDLHGRTIIEPSFNKPVRISRHFVLKPLEIPFQPEPGDSVICLRHGASFGTGQHPTTRLSLQGIDYVLNEEKPMDEKEDTSVLDIGTGSGVLAIAALLSGIDRGIGIDIDPCAISEAEENARINGLENRLEISDTPLENINQTFPLITANLRFPTLKNIYNEIIRLTEKDSALVFSGVKNEEVPKLMEIYTRQYFNRRWQKSEKGWGAIVFLKK